MTNVSERQHPFIYSRPVGQTVALLIIILGLLLLLIANSKWFSETTLLGASLSSILSNLGFALIVLSAFQWIFDYKYREKFFQDIQAQILSDQSIREAGITRVYENSRDISYTPLILEAKSIEVGITYSDRFLKDYFSDIIRNKDLNLRIFYVDPDAENFVSAIAIATSQTIDDVKNHFRNLERIIDELRKRGTKITAIKICSIPRYAFFRFDRTRIFLVPSTFTLRRTSVPAIELGLQGTLSEFVNGCIELAEGAGA